MTTPIFTLGDFVVCFEAIEEDQSARDHKSAIAQKVWEKKQAKKVPA